MPLPEGGLCVNRGLSREGAESALASAEFALGACRQAAIQWFKAIPRDGPGSEESGEARAPRNTMHETHRKAAEQHEHAAQAHRTAAEHNEKGDCTAAGWHSERALEYSNHAYKLAKEAHTKSGEIASL